MVFLHATNNRLQMIQSLLSLALCSALVAVGLIVTRVGEQRALVSRSRFELLGSGRGVHMAMQRALVAKAGREEELVSVSSSIKLSRAEEDRCIGFLQSCQTW